MALPKKLGIRRIVGGAGLAVLAAAGGVSRAQSATTQPTIPVRVTTQPAPAATGQTQGTDLTNLSLEDLMNLEVTSVSKHKQKVAEAPAAVTVITQDDIERSGLQTIPELLRLAPGLDVARIDSSQWAISSRGFNELFGNKLQVMMDGRTLYTPLFSGVFWDMQDYVLQDLDRIEVIRGPGATLWGSNAVNGVISIETKSAKDTQGLLVEGLGGNEQDNGAVRFGGKLDDQTYFRIFTKYRSFEDFPLPSGQDAHDGWQSLLGGVRVDRFCSDEDKLTFEASGYGSRNGQLINVPDLNSFTLSQMQASSFNAGEQYVLGRWTHTFSSTSDMAFQLYYDHLNREVWQENRYALNTVDADFQHRFALADRQEITWGLGYRFTADDFQGTELTPGAVSFLSPSRRDDYFASAFIQDDLTVVPDRLHLIAGTKLEQNSYSGFEVQPSAKVLWTPNDRNTVWGSISRAVRTPSRWEQDAVLTPAAVPTPSRLPGLAQVIGNPDFRSEKLVAYELGYRVKPHPRLSLDVSGFFNHYDDLQGFGVGATTINPGPPPYVMIPVHVSNNLYGYSYGAELAANWNVTDAWRLSASYTFLQLHITTSHMDPLSQKLLAQSAFDNNASPQNQFQIHSYLDVLKNLQLNASAYYVETLDIGVPSYVRADLGLVWQIRDGLRFAAGVQNLFDNGHPEFGGSRVNNVASEVPRTYYGQLTWSF